VSVKAAVAPRRSLFPLHSSFSSVCRVVSFSSLFLFFSFPFPPVPYPHLPEHHRPDSKGTTARRWRGVDAASLVAPGSERVLSCPPRLLTTYGNFHLSNFLSRRLHPPQSVCCGLVNPACPPDDSHSIAFVPALAAPLAVSIVRTQEFWESKKSDNKLTKEPPR
jgi:hypothetical protein